MQLGFMYVVVSRISIIGCCIQLDICFGSCRIFVLAFNSPHKLNSNSVIPTGSYGHSINLHHMAMKSSCSTSSATERIYGSTPLAVLVAASGDIFGSQFTAVTELSATKKSDAAVKNLPMNMPNLEIVVPNENIILTSISAPGLEQNNSPSQT